MAQIIPLLGRDSAIPLLGGVRGGSLGREILVNISRITDLPTPKSPPKRGLSNLNPNILQSKESENVLKIFSCLFVKIRG